MSAEIVKFPRPSQPKRPRARKPRARHRDPLPATTLTEAAKQAFRSISYLEDQLAGKYGRSSRLSPEKQQERERRMIEGVLEHAREWLERGLAADLAKARQDFSKSLLHTLGSSQTNGELSGARQILGLILEALPEGNALA